MEGYKRHIFNDTHQITWGHAVNSRKDLREAIASSFTMFEADIVMKKKLKNEERNAIEKESEGKGEWIPVMAHPPVIPDDAMPFTEWLDDVIKHYQGLKAQWRSTNEGGGDADVSRVFGIKLDFKDPKAVVPCLIHLKSKMIEHGLVAGDNDDDVMQVWLNADILLGPGGNPPIFDAHRFINECVEYFPGAVLSIGWTTGSQGTEYSEEMVDEMLSVCKTALAAHPSVLSADQFTFPVMAGFVRGSWPNLHRLLTQLEPMSSLTLWGVCDSTLLPWLQEEYPEIYTRRLFVDCRILTHEELVAMQKKYERQEESEKAKKGAL